MQKNVRATGECVYMKEKKIRWSKSGRESAKREVDLYKTLEKAATDEKKEKKGQGKA